MQKLIAFIAQIAQLQKDGEEVEGKEFILENDDAVDTLHRLIDDARGLQDEIVNLLLYTVVHEYRNGMSPYLVLSTKLPELDELVEALKIDFEPEREESITVEPAHFNEIPVIRG